MACETPATNDGHPRPPLSSAAAHAPGRHVGRVLTYGAVGPKTRASALSARDGIHSGPSTIILAPTSLLEQTLRLRRERSAGFLTSVLRELAGKVDAVISPVRHSSSVMSMPAD